MHEYDYDKNVIKICCHIWYSTHYNLWNVLIIEMPNFNYLIRFNSWNKWIFEINNHSNRSNRQVLLSFIFSCYSVSRSYYQLLPMERYVAGNLQSAWNEWRTPLPSAFISPPWVRKCQSKRVNSLDRWPTVVLLLSTLRTTTETVNLSVDQGHDSQLVTIFRLQRRMFTSGSLHSVSYRRDFCVICGIDIASNQSILLFSVAVQLLLTCAKPL